MEGFVAAALLLLRCRESAPEMGRQLDQRRLRRAGGEARFFYLSTLVDKSELKGVVTDRSGSCDLC